MKLTNKICVVGFLLVGICRCLVAADFYGGAIGQPGYSPFGTSSSSGGGQATNVMSSLVVGTRLSTNDGTLSIFDVPSFTNTPQVVGIDFSKQSNSAATPRFLKSIDGSTYTVLGVGAGTNHFNITNGYAENDFRYADSGTTYIILTNSLFRVAEFGAEYSVTNVGGTTAASMIFILSSNNLVGASGLTVNNALHGVFDNSGFLLQYTPGDTSTLTNLGLISFNSFDGLTNQHLWSDIRVIINDNNSITIRGSHFEGTITNSAIGTVLPQGTNTTYIAWEQASSVTNVFYLPRFRKLYSGNRAFSVQKDYYTAGDKYAFQRGQYLAVQDQAFAQYLFSGSQQVILQQFNGGSFTWSYLGDGTTYLMSLGAYAPRALSPGRIGQPLGTLALPWTINSTNSLLLGITTNVGDMYINGYSLGTAITSLSNSISGGGSQTPWLQTENGATFALTNISSLVVNATSADSIKIRSRTTSTRGNRVYIDSDGTSFVELDNSLLFTFNTEQVAFGLNTSSNLFAINHANANGLNSSANKQVLYAKKMESAMGLGQNYDWLTNHANTVMFSNLYFGTGTGATIASNNAGTFSIQTSNSTTSKIYQTITGVGIGTATPAKTFDVAGNFGLSGNATIASFVIAGNVGFGYNNANNIAFNSNGEITWSSGSGTPGGGRTRIYEQSAGTIGTTNVYVSSTVGIGTTTPLEKLHVANGVIRGDSGFASYAPHTPVAVSVGASPFNFTNKTPVAIECYFSGGTAYSVDKNGVTVFGSLAGDSYFVLQSNSWATVTYTIAPTVLTNAW